MGAQFLQTIDEPVRVCDANPHYFSYRGRPTVLITSAEHYGAVINLDFDYAAYLDTLRSYGLNYTRMYPGALIEPADKFISGNTLAPPSHSLLLPWARSAVPGYAQGGCKYDLDCWDDAYFERLRGFIAEAGRCGVVVELCLFNAQYEDTWAISPLYHANNIQGEGRCCYADVQTMRDVAVVARLDAYVRKLVQETNEFNNVIYEVCDEPFLTGTPEAEAREWVAHIIDVVVEAERCLPKRHLIAQQVEGSVDFSADPNVQVIVAQYVYEASEQQMGGMQALETKYDLGKPIELNETLYYPVWYEGDVVGASRAEAWDFIVGGGAGFNHLNGRFTAQDPRGATDDNLQVLSALRSLVEFINSFDFVAMQRDVDTLKGGWHPGFFYSSISEPGQQYAAYLHHSRYSPGKSGYIVEPGSYVEDLTWDLPEGVYNVQWLDPASGAIVATENLVHAGGERTLTTPEHAIDIALAVRRRL